MLWERETRWESRNKKNNNRIFYVGAVQKFVPKGIGFGLRLYLWGLLAHFEHFVEIFCRAE